MNLSQEKKQSRFKHTSILIWNIVLAHILVLKACYGKQGDLYLVDFLIVYKMGRLGSRTSAVQLVSWHSEWWFDMWSNSQWWTTTCWSIWTILNAGDDATARICRRRICVEVACMVNRWTPWWKVARPLRLMEWRDPEGQSGAARAADEPLSPIVLLLKKPQLMDTVHKPGRLALRHLQAHLHGLPRDTENHLNAPCHVFVL
jgi:hypothetical protein